MQKAWFFICGEAQWDVFTEEARDQILIRQRDITAFYVNRGVALIGGGKHRFRFGNNANEGNAQNFLNVCI